MSVKVQIETETFKFNKQLGGGLRACAWNIALRHPAYSPFKRTLSD